MLLEKDFQVITSLCFAVDIAERFVFIKNVSKRPSDKLAPSIVRFYAYHEQTIPLIEHFVQREVQATGEKGYILFILW